VSEDLSYLTDEDLEAIDAIVEGSRNRQMGEHILHMAEDAERRSSEQGQALLEAISQAHQAKASESGAEAEADNQ
jgi:hypothetical protein